MKWVRGKALKAIIEIDEVQRGDVIKHRSYQPKPPQIHGGMDGHRGCELRVIDVYPRLGDYVDTWGMGFHAYWCGLCVNPRCRNTGHHWNFGPKNIVAWRRP